MERLIPRRNVCSGEKRWTVASKPTVSFVTLKMHIVRAHRYSLRTDETIPKPGWNFTHAFRGGEHRVGVTQLLDDLLRGMSFSLLH